MDGDVIKIADRKGMRLDEMEQIHPKRMRSIRFSIAFHQAQELIHK